MTIEEKRWKLENHCRSCTCAQCPIMKFSPAEHLACDFTAGDASVDHWSNELIEQAYDLVFNPKSTNSAVDHPKHYNREGAMECIDEMVLIFGKEETMVFCKLNAWKYRYRAADKGAEEDLKKSDWYLAEYRRLSNG